MTDQQLSKLYAIAITMMENGKSTAPHAGWIFASSDEEAHRKGLEYALERFPRSRFYHAHEVACSRVPEEMLVRLRS